MILVSVLLSGCGQKGALYLPTGDAAAGRATLPETLRPGTTGATTAVNPANAASVPTGAATPTPSR